MKTSEIIPALMAGNKIAVGQYRDWESKTFPAKAANEEPTIITTTFVLVGREVVSVQSFVERGVKPETVKAPGFKPGDNVVVRFRDWASTKWGVRANGTVEPLQA